MDTMTIGQVAGAAGVGVETVRFYEREGLLAKPARSASGYRSYEPPVVTQVRFIRQAQRLGFTLREIKELLALRFDPQATRAQVKSRAIDKVADIDRRIAELQRMKTALLPLVQACDGRGSLAGCPILNAIETNDAPEVLLQVTPRAAASPGRSAAKTRRVRNQP
jgi:Cu(I)-responsive transcriptional regulator